MKETSVVNKSEEFMGTKQHPSTISRRSRGEGRIWKIGRIWWIQYYASGRQIRESSRSDLKPAAQRLLRRRLGEVAAGSTPLPRAARVRYEELREVLIADYQSNRRKWLRRGKDGEPYICGVSRLTKFFKGFRALAITTDLIRQYIRERQCEGAANGTINRELALLRRMFRLAVQDCKLREVPYFPMLEEAPPRKGFLEYESFQKLRQELPEYLRPVITMGFYTGMREGEIIGLRWEDVNLVDAQLHLGPESTKTREARTIPIFGELLEMLKIERQKNFESTMVFMKGNNPISSFQKAGNPHANARG